MGAPRFRVLELAGPATAPCGHLLAEAGADVIKIEPPDGAPERASPPLLGSSNQRASAYSLFHDTGKRAITLDLDQPLGQELFLRLAAVTDVIVEGLAPGELARRGLSYDVLRRYNRGLVLVSITPFGQTGPYRDFAANDLVVFAMGGLMFISGMPGHPPVVAPDQQACAVAATHAAMAALAVLWGRASTGEGDWVDVSMFECLAAQENTITNYLGPGNFARRNGSQHRTALPGRIFPCQDGYIHLFIGRERVVWERFLTWIGHPPELADPALADINVRWQHAETVTRLTEQFLRTRTKADLFASAQVLHLPCAPVYSPAEFLADPHTVSREVVVEIPHPTLGAYRTLRAPLPLAEASCYKPAPGVGEHNDEVYRSIVGLSPEELRDLRRRHVI